MTRGMRAGLGLAIAASAVVGCGKKRAADQAPPPPPIGLPARVPIAPPALKWLPTFVTLDELRGHQPTLSAVRLTSELALDASGKQALAAGCVTATGAKVAMHQLADAYGVARWVIKTRTTSQGDARGEFLGDFDVYDGTLHVRGMLAAAPACQPGEVGMSLSYTKVVAAPKPAPAPDALPDGAPARSAPTPAPP